jgi:hypothetical protein
MPVSDTYGAANGHHKSFLFAGARRFSNYQRGQRRIDVLELLRIVEALKDNPKRVFANRTERMSRE